MKRVIKPSKKFNGVVRVPGDKSISHRALFFGALSEGSSEIYDILDSADVRSTAGCLRDLGVQIDFDLKNPKSSVVHIQGRGVGGFQKPSQLLDCGNSGTTMRTILSILAAQKFETILSGDESLNRRPMKRVTEPLTKMGGKFELTKDNFAPIKVLPAQLHGIDYDLKIASAQVKTAIILAGLLATGKTKITGLIHSRDHTERMLPYYGVKLELESNSISIQGGQKLKAQNITVPGDPSSAAFMAAAVALVRNGKVTIENVMLNPSRVGFFNVLKRMGVDIQIKMKIEKPEPIGDIIVECKKDLIATEVQADEVPSMVDEIMLVGICATQAKGETIVRGAEELRVKESDRIEALATNLRKMGVEINTFEDGFSIKGPQKLKGTEIETFLDHRIAMGFSCAALIAEGETTIKDAECVDVSFPNFYESLERLS